jgi:uncharacterized protein (TIGR02421 family)
VQSLNLFRLGLPGFEELQEGLAVLSEYLVGGLNPLRLRVLAARVCAVKHLIEGATFMDLFRYLHNRHGFSKRMAFLITMRVFRGGGFTKDAIYLRGLVHILNFLKEGGEIESLYLGKASAEYFSRFEELKWRKIVVPPPLTPRVFTLPESKAKLKKLRKGMSVFKLLE